MLTPPSETSEIGKYRTTDLCNLVGTTKVIKLFALWVQNLRKKLSGLRPDFVTLTQKNFTVNILEIVKGS